MSHQRLTDDGRDRHPGAGHPRGVQTPADVRRLLADQISQLTANPDLDPLRKAGQLALLARVTLQAMEIESLDGRVEAIETVLRRRKERPARKSDGAMKTQHYDQFTPEERVDLLLAALAREDIDEVDRLNQRCPWVREVAADPAYTDLLNRMWDAVVGVLFTWCDVSHRVIQTRLTIALLNRRALGEVLEATVAGSTKRRQIVPQDRTSLLGAEVQAQWTKWSAVWQGIEAAITRFCADRDLTTEQLFAMAQRLPLAIEEAREVLNVDVPADPEAEASVYQALCDTVAGQHARSEPQNPRSVTGKA